MSKVLIIGSGGREHALAVFLAKSSKVNKVFCMPGNSEITNSINIDPTKNNNFPKILEFCKDNNISLVVIGPEIPLCNGIVDYLVEENIKVFGPTKNAAQLESSKSFARRFMEKYNIDQPEFKVFDNKDKALEYINNYSDNKIVIKASGLAAGKGVILCNNKNEAKKAINEMMTYNKFKSAGLEIVIEEFIKGEEISLFTICDGNNFINFPVSQDHKRIFENDKGPNTGGMGAYSPISIATREIMDFVNKEIITKVINGMNKEGIPYKGCLYTGLMIKDNKAKVVEFNCRFGDPETQAVLPLIETDIYDILLASVNETINNLSLSVKNNSSCCVILSSKGYPGKYEKGKIITGLDKFKDDPDIYIFHAGTSKNKNGDIITNGGRVLGITSIADNLEEAVKKVYNAIDKINFENMYYRKDIAYRELKRNK